jgi:hypothetical protein
LKLGCGQIASGSMSQSQHSSLMPPPPHTLALTLSLPRLAPVSTSFSAYLAPAVFSTDAVYASAAFAMTDDAKPSPMPSLVHYMPKFDGGEEV